MPRLTRSITGLLPALLMAASVTLLAFGLLSLAANPPPQRAAGASVEPFAASGGPNGTTSPEPGLAATPEPEGSATPIGSAGVSPNASSDVPPSPSSGASASPAPSGTGPTPAIPTAAAPAALATRVTVPSEGIDLPIVSGDLRVRGRGPDDYPLCDVAQYLTYYGQPGEPGTTYLYAHAREGMFLPLLDESERRDGASLLGALVEVYTADDRLHLYEIDRVKRHATDFSLADNVRPGEHRLILQTSEGPRGTVPKLQVRARPIGVVAADPGDAHPEPKPRVCYGE